MKTPALLSFGILIASDSISALDQPLQQDGSLISIEFGNLFLQVDSTYGVKVYSLMKGSFEFMVTSDCMSLTCSDSD